MDGGTIEPLEVPHPWVPAFAGMKVVDAEGWIISPIMR
jgi:hypothetical protein